MRSSTVDSGIACTEEKPGVWTFVVGRASIDCSGAKPCEAYCIPTGGNGKGTVHYRHTGESAWQTVDVFGAPGDNVCGADHCVSNGGAG